MVLNQLLMTFYYTQRSVHQSAAMREASFCSRRSYRDPQMIKVQNIHDYGLLILKWDTCDFILKLFSMYGWLTSQMWNPWLRIVLHRADAFHELMCFNMILAIILSYKSHCLYPILEKLGVGELRGLSTHN